MYIKCSSITRLVKASSKEDVQDRILEDLDYHISEGDMDADKKILWNEFYRIAKMFKYREWGGKPIRTRKLKDSKELEKAQDELLYTAYNSVEFAGERGFTRAKAWSQFKRIGKKFGYDGWDNKKF